jgi:hypothetical protein
MRAEDSGFRVQGSGIWTQGSILRTLHSALCTFVGLLLLAGVTLAEPPHASYIFPAGGQRGTKVAVKIGGHFLHERATFEILGAGIGGPGEIHRTETTWFEGPLIKQPASQQSEDYPKDYAADIDIAADAEPRVHFWRVWNAQGITPAMKFVVGDLPEVVEDEIEGEPIATPVTLPVTINGRIFPREDRDAWTFGAAAGQSVTCSVAAAEFGSPLAARLEVRGPDGQPLAEATSDAQGRVQLRFTPAETGQHAVHVHDVQAGGLQHYVYRLTITSGPWIDAVYPLGGRRGSELTLHTVGQAIPGNSLTVQLPAEIGVAEVVPRFTAGADGTRSVPTTLMLDVDDLPEQPEAEPNQDEATATAMAFPSVANGRIEPPGDRDVWKLTLAKGQSVQLSLKAGQLGSPLAGVVIVRDAAGKELAKSAWLDQQKDVELTLIAPADGDYFVEVHEQFPSRGGPAFAYRLRAAQQAPDLDLLLAADGVAVDIGGSKNVEVKVLRRSGFKAPLTLHVEGLPAGVTCDEVKVAANADKVTLVFKAADNIPVVTSLLRVIGRAEVEGKLLERIAHVASRPGEPPLGHLRLVTTLKTPFKFTALYDFRYTPRGTTLKKRYVIDRGGYEGPLVAQLADRQGRHLQGVTGPVVTVPAGATEFEYTLFLPPWMELGRTSRTNLMLTGEIKDAAGTAHKVCFTTRDQNEQMIALVSPSLLRIIAEKPSLLVQPGTQAVVPIQIKRDRIFTSPLRLELVLPAHVRDVSAEPLVAPADAQTASIEIRFGSAPGPLNMPLLIRATAEREGEPVVAETVVELVLP